MDLRKLILCVFEISLSLAVSIQITIVDISYDNIWLADKGVFSSTESNLKFELKGCKEAHIILSSQLIKQPPFYHIGIGLDTNTKTILARESVAYGIVDELLGNDLDCNNFRQFWISWFNGKIRFGKGLNVDVNTILAYDEDCPFAIQNIEISSDIGATLVWNFYSPTSSLVEQPAAAITKVFSEIQTCPRFESLAIKQIGRELLCGGVCAKETSCHAFIFDDNTGVCELFSNIVDLNLFTYTYYKIQA
ncbi:Hypothetical predicted protein [Mytilus galloprovincialis]|uniref:Farnesoic acid O-methyl transferase domain-containing protein n=1 Tax=Mytilus galloprovincialis TaxID=29158 RepID=A0A8B6GTJ1_MYTGA|nr:Hypothetical predicted protein [Mytilus galloprovincialis]